MLGHKTSLDKFKSITKEVKDLYTENNNIFMKETEDDKKTLKDIPCS